MDDLPLDDDLPPEWFDPFEWYIGVAAHAEDARGGIFLRFGDDGSRTRGYFFDLDHARWFRDRLDAEIANAGEHEG